MIVVEHWVSPEESARREADARAEAEQDAWWQQFKATDPMLLRLAERVRELRIPCEFAWQSNDYRVFQYFRRVKPPAAADLDWRVREGSLKLQLYSRTGGRDREVSFEHTLEGMEACIEALAHVFSTGSAN